MDFFSAWFSCIFHSFWFESIGLIHLRLLNTHSLFLPGVFCLVSFSQWLLQLGRYSAENAWQVNLLLELLGKMLCWTLKVLQPLHNSRTRIIRDSPALELHAITAVDWLERQMQCTHKTTTCTNIVSSYTEQLFVDVIRRQLWVVLCINDYGRWGTLHGRLHHEVRMPVLLCVSTRLMFKTSWVDFGINQCTINCLTLMNSALVIRMLRFAERKRRVRLCMYAGLFGPDNTHS